MLIRGDLLPPRLREHVLGTFVHRWTHENLRQRPQVRRIVNATIEPVSDAQWLREHAFHVTRAGKLDARRRFAEPAYMAGE